MKYTEDQLVDWVQDGTITVEEAKTLASRAGMTHTKSSEAQSTDRGNLTWSDVPEGLATVGKGALNAYKSAIGLPVDIINWLGEAINADPVANPRFNVPKVRGGSEDVETLANILSAYIPTYTPNTPFKKGLEAVSQGAAAMAAPGAGSHALALGALSGGAGHAVERLGAEGAGKDAARVAALLPGLLAARTPKITKTLQDAVTEPGVDLAKIAAAQKAASSAIGAPTLLSHFAPDRSKLLALLKEVAESPQGGAMQRTMAGEQAAMAGKRAEMISGISPLMPETNTRNMITEAGDKAMGRPGAVRTALTSSLFKKAGQDVIPGEEIPFLTQALQTIGEKYHLGPTSDAGRAIKRGVTKVEGAAPPSIIINPKTNKGFTSDLNVLDINTLKREAATRAADANKIDAKSSEINKFLGESNIAGELNKTAEAFSPDLAAGNRLYSRATKTLVEPVQKGPLAEMFPPVSRATGVGDWGQFSELLKNPTKYSGKDVAEVGQRLKKANPKAWPLIVKQHMMSAAETAGDDMGAFAKKLVGKGETAVQQEGITREAVKQVALTQGRSMQDAEAAADGAIKLFTAMRNIADGQKKIRPSISEAGEVAGKNILASAARLFNPFSLYVRAWAEARPLEQAVRKKVFSSIADLASSPEGTAKLLEISRYDKVAEIEKLLLRGAVAIRAGGDSSSE